MGSGRLHLKKGDDPERLGRLMLNEKSGEQLIRRVKRDFRGQCSMPVYWQQVREGLEQEDVTSQGEGGCQGFDSGGQPRSDPC